MKPNPKRKFDLGKDAFIRLAPILEILRCAIWTGRLSDEKPVSVMLIAEQESCKTECLKFFSGSPTLRYISDLTSRGLAPYKKDIESGQIRHLVLLDLVRLISHGRNISDRTLQTIASLMEEGESETSDAGGRDSWKNFPRIGCLMALTPDFFHSKRGKWRQTGFLSRFLPISFRYSDESVKVIHAAIAHGHHMPAPAPEMLPPHDVQIFCPLAQSKALGQQAKLLGEKMGTYGFRYQRILRALAKAHARIEGKGEVSEKHVLKVIEWSEFFTSKEVIL